MLDILDVSAYVINLCNRKSLWIPVQRLQNVLFVAQVYYLSCAKEPEMRFCAFFRATDLGVKESWVFREFKQYHANIPWQYFVRDYDWGGPDDVELRHARELPKRDERIIDRIVKMCAKLHDAELEHLVKTHPCWQKAIVANGDIPNSELALPIGKRRFRKSIEKRCFCV